ncbi:hypothetical protein PIB30_080661 [Stylosanthes scabra]|uniref:Uncharacterized protein n=1 Tax=Stylosanthes scabra TaxID=79078 RepID=A0ABU6YQG1_9FABA|nr:hypothetical protein [Stylosanthes scabra]
MKPQNHGLKETKSYTKPNSRPDLKAQPYSLTIINGEDPSPLVVDCIGSEKQMIIQNPSGSYPSNHNNYASGTPESTGLHDLVELTGLTRPKFDKIDTGSNLNKFVSREQDQLMPNRPKKGTQFDRPQPILSRPSQTDFNRDV